MRYRFIGDPMERESGKPLSRPAEDTWHDMPGDPVVAAKIRANGHYEVEGVPVAAPKRRAKAAAPAPKPAPVIETDGWEEGE